MTVFEEEYKGYKICIENDVFAANPRKEFDGNIGIFIGWARIFTSEFDYHVNCPEEAKALMKEQKAFASIPIYGYSHSGIYVSSTPFNCPWDSGLAGFMFTTKEKLKEAGLQGISVKEAEEYLKAELEVFNHYVSGCVYGYVIVGKDLETVDSCYGFYVEPEEVVKEAKNIIDSL